MTRMVLFTAICWYALVLITQNIIVFNGNFDIDSTDQDLPSYLEEEPNESPEKEGHAVARPNANGFGSMASSWFGSVLNAVNKNLYW